MKNKSKIIVLIIIIMITCLSASKIIKAEEMSNETDDDSLKDILGSEYIEGIELTTNHKENTNYVNLGWKLKENKGDWTYRVYQRTEGESEFKTVSSKYNKQVKVLNIYPCEGADGLQEWMKTYGKDEISGEQLISVDKVYIGDFNSNPNSYLKYDDGKYKYDVLVFGFWDTNADAGISDNAFLETEEFIKSGRGVLFGHDTVRGGGWTSNGFYRFGKYCNLSLTGGDKEREGTVVSVTRKGYLTKYPHQIEDKDLIIPNTHTGGQYAGGNIWIRFGSKYSSIWTSSVNFYLSSWNNCAMIETGHSS